MNPATLFGVWPYLAVAIAAAGFVARVLLVKPGAQPAATEGTRGAWDLLGGRRIWRAGWLLLLAGHLLVLAVPQAIVRWNVSPARLYLLEAGGFLCGLLAAAGLVGGLARHVGEPRVSGKGRLAGAAFDTAFLGALAVSLVSGLLVAVRYRWASSWGAATVVPYVRSLAAGDPVTALAVGLPSLVQLHVVAALAAVALVPLSRVGGALALLARRLVDLAARPLAAVTSRAGEALRARNLRSWLWPEEDELDVPLVHRQVVVQRGPTGRGGPGRPDRDRDRRPDLVDAPVIGAADSGRPSWPATGGR